jgi:thiol-disulfide isomerase/thioredoxin
MTPDRPAGLGSPAAIDPPSLLVDPTRIGAADSVRRDPPVTSIPNGPSPPTGPAADARTRETAEQPPIPFCSLSGRQLSNFALYDLNGQPWEWRLRNNKLTLIDFWGTWCPACLHAIPHLNVLNEKYAHYGLEVVGIAYENNAPTYQVEQVRRVAQRLNMHYTLLLGSDRLTCPVRVQFRVVQWPSLFLVDASGRIIWQGSGLDRQQANELDKLIRKQLGIR